MLVITLRLSVPAAFVVWLIALLFPFYGKKNSGRHQLSLQICVSRHASSHSHLPAAHLKMRMDTFRAVLWVLVKSLLSRHPLSGCRHN